MTKIIFLKRLETALHNLPAAEREEIIRDYSAHFDEALAEGRNAEETAEALGSPEALAAEYLGGRQATGKHLLARLLEKLARLRKAPSHPVERVLAWTPGASMTIALPAEVHWRPAQTARATIHGDAWVIEHLRLDSDRLHGRMGWPFAYNRHIRLELEGPAIGIWKLIGSGDLYLHDVSQDILDVSIEGSGDIVADGAVTDLRIAIDGTGDVDSGALAQKTAAVTIKGMGDATIAPTEKAWLTIAGSGDICLMTEPKLIETNVSGGGDIRFAKGFLQQKLRAFVENRRGGHRSHGQRRP